MNNIDQENRISLRRIADALEGIQAALEKVTSAIDARPKPCASSKNPDYGCRHYA